MKLKLATQGEKYSYGTDFTQIVFSEEINLYMGKEDWSSFQLYIQSDDYATVSVGKTPMFSNRGNFENIRVEVLCTQSLACAKLVGEIEDDDGCFKSELLLNEDNINIEPNHGQLVWIELKTNEKSKAGIYEGKVNVYSHKGFDNEKLIETLKFTYEIKDFVMPKVQDYKFNLDLWQHNCNIARKHEVVIWSDEHFNILEKYIQSLALLGQKTITAIVSEIPWTGQRAYRSPNYVSDMYEYNMVNVSKNSNGDFVYDFSVLERYINLCFKYNINKEIEVFGLLNIWIDEDIDFTSPLEDYEENIRIRYFDEKTATFCYLTKAFQIKEYIEKLKEFFVEKNLMEIVYISADEPQDKEKFKKSIKEFKNISTDFKFKTAIEHFEFVETFKDDISNFVVALSSACAKEEEIKKFKEQNLKISYYVCCLPKYPNTYIHSLPCESRVLGLLAYKLNLDGLLRWSYSAWPQNPRERISFRYPGWSAGDCNLIYPSRNGKPLLSVRWKYLKRGIEDFELLTMLKQKGKEEIIQQVLNTLIKSNSENFDTENSRKKPEELYEINYQQYEKARGIMLDNLS